MSKWSVDVELCDKHGYSPQLITRFDCVACELGRVQKERDEARAEAARLREALTVSDRANWAAHVCIRENLPGFVGDLQLLAEAQDMTRNALSPSAGRDYRALKHPDPQIPSQPTSSERDEIEPPKRGQW